MARRFKLKELEATKGDLHKVIPPLVNQIGQAGAAEELGVSQFTISRWLRDNGYEMTITYTLTDAARAVLHAKAAR